MDSVEKKNMSVDGAKIAHMKENPGGKGSSKHLFLPAKRFYAAAAAITL